MRRIVLAFALVLAGLARAAAPAPETLEGTEWKVRNKSFKAKIVFWHFDHISFRDGLFESRDWKAKGFAPASFVAAKPSESVTWTASLSSPEQGKLVWEGRREGTRMEGTWTWRRPNGKSKTMPWSAKQVFHR